MFDRIAITHTVTVAAGVFAPGPLGAFTSLIPFDMVDEVLTETLRVQQREGLLPARVVNYLLLAGCLFAELGYTQVWQQLTAGLSGPVGRRRFRRVRRVLPEPDTRIRVLRTQHRVLLPQPGILTLKITDPCFHPGKPLQQLHDGQRSGHSTVIQLPARRSSNPPTTT